MINKLFNYDDSAIIALVEEVVVILNKKISYSDSSEVKRYISDLSGHRGTLVLMEAQLKKSVDEKLSEVLEQVKKESSEDKRKNLLQILLSDVKSNYEVIKELREEVNNKSTQASSMLKSIDNKNS